MCLRKLFIGFGLLLLLSVPLFSDVVLTEAEYQELMESLTISETALIEQEKTIETLQTELSALKNELSGLKSELNALKNLSKIQNEIIETLSALSEELKESLTMQRPEINGGLTAILDDGKIKPGIYLGITY
jgi:predicted nuclease with TOPRIM domain